MSTVFADPVGKADEPLNSPRHRFCGELEVLVALNLYCPLLVLHMARRVLAVSNTLN